jgi:hypothetical protein
MVSILLGKFYADHMNLEIYPCILDFLS